ncbi:MAG: Zn-ribbon domain-containing OB-fold protein [Planctomycetes bacterium]|nr:Zn-ribbon domain-containing OB-fold protein [Planctomycetota bacterium]
MAKRVRSMQDFDFRGTALSADEFSKGKVITTTGEPHAEYAWDCGPAISRYLEELRNGRLIARWCKRCNRTMLPPRMFCELCWCPTTEWRFVRDTGIVNTFSLCNITWDMKPLKTPQIPAVIEIDGASAGMGIMHLIGGCDPRKVRIGMKVKAVWKPAAEREGAITDILHFTPA